MGGKREKLGMRVLMISLCSIMIFSGLLGIASRALGAEVPPIKIAIVLSLSGTLSRNGNLTLQGIKAAMNWVNDNGGIKSLGGAKLIPVIGDAASTVEGGASAMDRVCRDPDIVMAVGAWASSITMSTTEITERLGIPQFSTSFFDKLHERGFKWGFYIDPPSSVYGDLGVGKVVDLAEGEGAAIKTGAIITDNMAASKGYCDAVKAYFKKAGIKLIGEEAFTMGTLTDATPIMQNIKTLNPDVVMFAPASIAECQLIFMKKLEMKVNIPFIGATGTHVDPQFRQVGGEALQGFITFSPVYPQKYFPQDWITRSLEQCKKEYSDEPWVGQELSFGWALIPVMAEILERAGSRDHQAIWDAAHKLDIHDVTATRAYAKQGVAFDEKGRIVKKYQDVMLIQWQSGIPHVIYPSGLATAKPIWRTK
jgi:branched-chain amino acid transport system substrate-binding protein